ncbi:hypothetical protein VIGAN_04246200 [Vigna angularis var. angularis]|uniref:Uncharacterized protein n=1 Tax=Vigna angularis var. angularis TaxID=157739 RepID=A0A0S3RWJ4_PHAAN|nr:hypothetical protein VIGAN_04246200 [Vigna angularis var. angularis]
MFEEMNESKQWMLFNTTIRSRDNTPRLPRDATKKIHKANPSPSSKIFLGQTFQHISFQLFIIKINNLIESIFRMQAKRN